MTLLRVIAVFILIYLAFRVITMYVMPWLLRKFIERQSKKFYGENYHGRRSSQKEPKEGDVHVKQKHKTQISSENLGEYVDYKEIKDKDTSKNNE